MEVSRQRRPQMWARYHAWFVCMTSCHVVVAVLLPLACSFPDPGRGSILSALPWQARADVCGRIASAGMGCKEVRASAVYGCWRVVFHVWRFIRMAVPAMTTRSLHSLLQVP